MNRDEAGRMHVAQDPGTAARLGREVAGAANEAPERAVEAGRTPVPALIPSDGRTGMGIRGVGRTGRTGEHTIELRPGGHGFEGRRPGDRSKPARVAMTVGGGASVEVWIGRDEHG